MVTAEDIVELDLDGQPVRDDKRTLYLERSSPCQSHGSLLTRRWSKPDSNSRSHLRRYRCEAQE
jgi:hypothetical protein